MRDTRLDVLRGIAMITIVINHMSAALVRMGMTGWEIPTPTRHGWSSAAELFVLMSGYMVGLVYMAKPDASARLLARGWHLLKVNILMFVVLAPLVLVAPAAMIGAFRLQPLLSSPVEAIALFPVFLYSPRLLDILQMYIIFMVASALLLPLLVRKPWVALAISVVIYVAAQILPWFNLPLSPVDHRRPTFHPLAWQLLFFAAVLAGRHRLHERLFDVAGRWRVFLPVVAALAIIAVLKAVEDHGLVPTIVGVSRGSLGPLRIVHAALLVTAYAGVITMLGRHRRHWLVDSIASIGRNSLNCFVLSVIGTYALAYLWSVSGTGWAGYLAATGFLLMAVRAGAYYWDQGRHRADDKAWPLMLQRVRSLGDRLSKPGGSERAR